MKSKLSIRTECIPQCGYRLEIDASIREAVFDFSICQNFENRRHLFVNKKRRAVCVLDFTARGAGAATMRAERIFEIVFLFLDQIA